MARIYGLPKLERLMLSRLNAADLARERRWLAEKSQDAFELPYGRAWLVLMLAELSRRRLSQSVASEIARLKDDNEDRVLEFLKRGRFPEIGNTFVATHQSWLFALLLLVLSIPTRLAVKRELLTLRHRAQAQRAALAKQRSAVSDFLYLPAVLAVLDRVGHGRPRLPHAYPLEPALPLAAAPLNDTNAHSAGAAMVRLWPHAVLASRGNTMSRGRVSAGMAEMFARPDQWRDDFERVAHWVPQFMWMTEWLELGRA